MEIYRAGQAWAAQMLRDLLAAEGIAAHVRESFGVYHRRTEFIVYLEDAADAGRAQPIVEGFREDASAEPADPRWTWPWRCPSCGEDVEPQFTACWNCQTPRPAAS